MRSAFDEWERLSLLISFMKSGRGAAISYRKRIILVVPEGLPIYNLFPFDGWRLIDLNSRGWCNKEGMTAERWREPIKPDVSEDMKLLIATSFSGNDLLVAIHEQTQIIRQTNVNLDALAQAAHEQGQSWSAIGEAANVSQQAAHKRWSPLSVARSTAAAVERKREGVTPQGASEQSSATRREDRPPETSRLNPEPAVADSGSA
jgi:hypothetical protein